MEVTLPTNLNYWRDATVSDVGSTPHCTEHVDVSVHNGAVRCGATRRLLVVVEIRVDI
jgi:hypothetical protein